MYRRVSETARYGGLTRGKAAIDQHVKNKMKKVLKEIQDGTFAKEWVNAYDKEGRRPSASTCRSSTRTR